MWKTFFDYLQSIVTLSKDVERLDTSYKRLDEKVDALTLTVQQLADEIRLNAQREQYEREKLVLQFKLLLIELERRLPPPPSNKDEK